MMYRVAQIVPIADIGDITFIDITKGDPDFQYNWYVQIFRYAMRPLNIIDFLSVAPYYIQYFEVNKGYQSLVSALRLSRLIRLFGVLRLLRLIKLQLISRNTFEKEMKVVKNALINAGGTIFLMVFSFVLLFAILGSLQYLLEQVLRMCVLL
jgi:hypothetical protein